MKIKTMFITGLLAISIYAGDSAPPTQATESFDATNWAPGSNVESIESGNVENIIHGTRTAVQINNVLGKYYNRESSEIWGDYEYGLYTMSNSIDPFSFLTIENYGNISSDYVTGVNMVGLNGQLNNHTTGYIFGGSVGVQIDGETGESLYNGFGIFNEGIITGFGIGVFQLNDNKSLYINNTGSIEADKYGIITRGISDIVNSGTIASYFKAGIMLMNGGTVTNTGNIRSVDNRFTSFVDPNDSILSANALTLKGDYGNYLGNIKYSGNDVDSSLKAHLTLDNTHVNFKNSRLENWRNIDINGGENYVNIEYNFQSYYNSRAEVYLNDGAILQTGDGRTGDANFYVNNGILNPYENNYDNYTSSGSLYWDRPATQTENGQAYYNKKEFERLTVNNLNVGAQGGIVIDFRVAQPFTEDSLGFPEMDIKDESHKDSQGNYAGYGYGGWFNIGEIVLKQTYQRVNYDKIDIKGTSYIADGATLYIVDRTYETSEENPFIGNYDYKIDIFNGDISFDDFTNIEFYSSTVGIDHFDNATGMLHLKYDKFDDYGQNIVDWWIKQTSLGFANVPEVLYPNATATTMTMTTMSVETPLEKVQASAAEVKPYEVKKDYSANIDNLQPSEELKQVIYGFDEWADIDSFMDSINKLEYASLAASNLNSINTRVNSMYNRLGNYNTLLDNSGLDIWFDTYMTDGSLQGKGNHDISGRGFEVSAGVNKSITDNIVLGLSVNHTDYTSSVNDSGSHTNIESEGYGVNVFGLWQPTASLIHKFTAGMTNYNNTDEIADFNSTEMFVSYRAEYLVKINQLSLTPLAGFRYASVKYSDAMIDAENGLQGFTHNSLESELGLRVARQFKKLNVNVSGSWLHEMLDTSNTSTAFTSFGNFEQTGIERDADSFELGLGVQYQFNDKVMLDIDYTREFSANSNNSGLEAKLTFRF